MICVLCVQLLLTTNTNGFAQFYFVAAAIDLKGIQNTRYNDNENNTYIIGDYNFDPLNLYPIDTEGQQRSK